MTESPSPVTLTGQLLSLLAQLSGDNLAELDDRIATKERELATLRKLRSVLTVGDPATPKPKPVARPADEPKIDRRRKEFRQSSVVAGPAFSVADERRRKCGRYIRKNGVTTAADLCRLFGIPAASQADTFDHEWFVAVAGGIDLSPLGRAAVRGDGPND